MTAEEAIKILEVAKAEVEWTAPLEYQEAIDMAIEALQNIPTQMSGTSGSDTNVGGNDLRKQLNVLADVLDGCPLTHPCDKLWKPTGWCEKHCKDGRTEPSKECWLKYAEVMAKCTE